MCYTETAWRTAAPACTASKCTNPLPPPATYPLYCCTVSNLYCTILYCHCYCRHCYHMLHYTVEGALLYDDFHVFPYTHDA